MVKIPALAAISIDIVEDALVLEQEEGYSPRRIKIPLPLVEYVLSQIRYVLDFELPGEVGPHSVGGTSND